MWHKRYMYFRSFKKTGGEEEKVSMIRGIKRVMVPERLECIQSLQFPLLLYFLPFIIIIIILLVFITYIVIVITVYQFMLRVTWLICSISMIGMKSYGWVC